MELRGELLRRELLRSMNDSEEEGEDDDRRNGDHDGVTTSERKFSLFHLKSWWTGNQQLNNRMNVTTG